MKVAFVSDTHFGYPRFEEDASRQGRAAILDAANRADVLVLGGDIFDTRLPKLETLAEVATLLAEAGKILSGKAGGKLKATNLVIGIHGTHERRGKDALNPVQMMAKLGLMDDVHNRTVVVEGEGGRAAFSGMGGVPDDLVSDALKHLCCKAVGGARNFFIFHQTMQEFVPQAKGLASIEELPEGHDWYLCGHMHKRSEYMGGRLLIPGSTVITQLREEEGGKKGYFLIDTGENIVEWVEIQCRHMEVLNLVFGGQKPSEARAMIISSLSSLAGGKWEQKPIVKVKLSGRLAAGGELDLSGIEQDGMEVFFDSSLEGGDMAFAMEKLREMWMVRATPSEIGKARLAQNAAKRGISAKRADELFQMFCE